MQNDLFKCYYLDNEAMNEKHKDHSKCGKQEMLPSH